MITVEIESFDIVNICCVEFVHVVQMSNRTDRDEAEMAKLHGPLMEQYQQKISSTMIIKFK